MGLFTTIYNKKVKGFCDNDECGCLYRAGKYYVLGFQIKTGEFYDACKDFTVGDVIDHKSDIRVENGFTMEYCSNNWKNNCTNVTYFRVVPKQIIKYGKVRDVQVITDVGIVSEEHYKKILHKYRPDIEAIERTMIEELLQVSEQNKYEPFRVANPTPRFKNKKEKLEYLYQLRENHENPNSVGYVLLESRIGWLDD